MINPPPDRVQVWASQLRANDLPPVCAMTGRPAETWRRFRFVTAPTWAYWFLLLLCIGIGLLLIFIIIRLVSRTAAGHLPLTRSSSNTLRNVNWFFAGAILLGPVMWVVGFAVGANSPSDSSGSGMAGILFLLGLFVLLGSLAAWLVVRPLVGPRGKVMEQLPGQYDYIVELSNVHPAFVLAVQQHQHARFAQAYGRQAPQLPGSA